MKPVTSPWIEIRGSSIHNRGAFSLMDIPKGTRIIEYAGEKITKAEAEMRCDRDLEANKKNGSNGRVYIFELNNKYDIDGNVSWNTARFINHSCQPNCETDIIKGKIWIIALRDIKKGEEITYNYGYDLDNFWEHPCNCGSANCVGYIVNDEYWDKLKRILWQRPELIRTNLGL